jgi:cytochrome b6-f complex iron-sulfur subunit
LDSTTIVLVGIVALILLFGVFLFATARRRDESQALSGLPDEVVTDEAVSEGAGERLPVPIGSQPTSRSGREVERGVAVESAGRATPPAPPAVPPDEETLGVTRRQVLNRGIVSTMLLAIGGFSASMVAMLWPTLSGGFGSKIRVGTVDEVMAEIEEKKEPYYVGAGRLYVTPYPQDAVPAAKGVAAYSAVVEGYEQGVTALYQKCPHLGCRVPWCKTSQWFECPCHGSQYNRVGEKKGGPAPRGMDRFAATVEGGTIVVDTGTVIPGPPIGVDTTGQEAEGPHCIGATEGGH